MTLHTLDTPNGLRITGVADRGVPNKERILIRVVGAVHLGDFGVGIGHAKPGAGVSPIPNYFFYFNHFVPEQESWIVLYTGVGEMQVSKLPTTHETAYSMHWGLEGVLFAHPEMQPLLFSFAGLGFDESWLQTLPPSAPVEDVKRPFLPGRAK